MAKEKNVDGLLEALNTLWANFNNCRAHFPCVGRNVVGAKLVSTGGYYKAQGLDISFAFNRGITLAEVEKINQIGDMYWFFEYDGERYPLVFNWENVFGKLIKMLFSGNVSSLILNLRMTLTSNM